MEQALGKAADDELKELLQNTSFIGLMVDESVDIAVNKNLIIYIKLLIDGELKIVFGDIVKVGDGKSQTILQAIVKFMKDRGIEFSKLVGFASDGANVMIGSKQGVATRLKHINPNVITIHCAAHRLALAAFHGAKAFPPLMDLQRSVTLIFNFFQYSATRYERVRNLHAILQTQVKKFKKPTSVRWLSVESAISAVVESWPVLLLSFENEFEENKIPEAKCLSQKINSYRFLAKACMVLDVLIPIGKLSKVFQKDLIDVDTMNSTLDATITALETMKTTPGPTYIEHDTALNNLKPSDTALRAIESLRKRYITVVIAELRKRFPQNTVTMLNHLNNVLNPNMIPQSARGITIHGKESLDCIVEAYGSHVKEKILSQLLMAKEPKEIISNSNGF